MFTRVNFDALREAIEVYTTSDISTLKAGLKQNLFYLLKRSAKVLKGLFLTQSQDNFSSEVDKFNLKKYKITKTITVT